MWTLKIIKRTFNRPRSWHNNVGGGKIIRKILALTFAYYFGITFNKNIVEL